MRLLHASTRTRRSPGLYGSYRMHNYLFYCLAKHLINQFFYVFRIRHQLIYEGSGFGLYTSKLASLWSNTISRAIVITILDAS